MRSRVRLFAEVALVVFLMPVSLLCAANAPKTRERHRRHNAPKAELFLGYSHFRGAPTLRPGNRMVGLNGGNASLALNFSRYFGLVADFGGYNTTELRLSGAGAAPPRVADADGKVFTYLFGPKFALRNSSRLTPFAQVLFGGAHASEVSLSGCTGGLCTPLPSQNAFALTAGGGLDIRVFHHVSIRAVQAEYMMTRFADVTSGSSQRQNDLRLSAGLVFLFGGSGSPVPPVNGEPTASCSTENKTIYAGSGDSAAIRAQASDPDNDPLTYSWTTTGGSIDGSGPEVKWRSAGTTPGTYTVNLRVEDGRGGTAHCSTIVQVEPAMNQSPTMSCSTDHNSVASGDQVQVTATASDANSDPLTFSWSSASGRVIGTGPSVKFDTTGLATGQYQVMGQVNDGHGGTAECSVSIQALAPTPLELRLALHSIYFPTAQTSAERPNGGLLTSQKQTLNELAGDFQKYLESKPDAHLILEGHSDPRGSVEYNHALSQRRVDRTKRYLMERGIPEGSIETKAYGTEQNLTDEQVKDAVERNSDLSSEQRQKLLGNLATIILASNRRVDITLSTTGQHSLRQYPFNAADSLTLLKQERAGKTSAEGSIKH